MIRDMLQKFINKKNTTDSVSFSDFFQNASIKEKKDLLTEVAKEANADQRKIIEESKKIHPQSV